MESGIDESKEKQPMLTFELDKGGELRASSTNMTQQLGGGGFIECQGSTHERSIFPVYPAEKLNQHRGGNVCEESKINSMTVNLSPDDVVSVIGEIQFWKARRTIANQQRLFVAQVFELHRLIKVQKLIAESPDIMYDEGAYLGNLLKAPAQKRVCLNHEIEPISDIEKHRVVYEKTDERIQNLEKAVEKTPISSSQIDNKLSNYEEPRSGLISLLYRPGPPNLMTGNYLNHMLRPHYQTFSPAIFLPPSLIPSMPPSLDKMEALHKCYENIYNILNQYSELAREVLKFSPSNNKIRITMENASSHTTQKDPYTPTACSPPCGMLVVPLMPPSSDSMYKMDYHHKCYQTLCNMLNKNSEFVREVMKFNSSMSKVSMASTSSPTTLTNSCTLERVKQPVRLIPPTSSAINFGTSNQPIQDFETQQDESDTSFDSSDDDFDSDYLSSCSDTSPSSPANDAGHLE